MNHINTNSSYILGVHPEPNIFLSIHVIIHIQGRCSLYTHITKMLRFGGHDVTSERKTGHSAHKLLSWNEAHSLNLDSCVSKENGAAHVTTCALPPCSGGMPKAGLKGPEGGSFREKVLWSSVSTGVSICSWAPGNPPWEEAASKSPRSNSPAANAACVGFASPLCFHRVHHKQNSCQSKPLLAEHFMPFQKCSGILFFAWQRLTKIQC